MHLLEILSTEFHGMVEIIVITRKNTEHGTKMCQFGHILGQSCEVLCRMIRMFVGRCVVYCATPPLHSLH